MLTIPIEEYFDIASEVGLHAIEDQRVTASSRVEHIFRHT